MKEKKFPKKYIENEMPIWLNRKNQIHMNFNDEFFNKVEKKTKVNKKTILDLAEKLNNGNMKNENTIREVIGTLSKMTGKNISKEKEDRIIETILKDKVPKSIDKMF